MTKSEIINQKNLINLEKLEHKYLNKYFYFLKFAEDELLAGFQTKFKIKDDWEYIWNPSEDGKGISDFATGAERIVYSLINGKGIGQPNSAPIGADLFFEVEDAFIHIDLKTVQTRNIGDYLSDIFVGNNQNSYRGKIKVSNKFKIYDEASLPHYYKLEKNTFKPCLTFFITILYEENNLEIINMNILSMPNGALYNIYGHEILKAGKVKFKKSDPNYETHQKSIRYRWSKCLNYKLLDNSPFRIKVAYINNNINETIKSKLGLFYKIKTNQSI